ANPMNVRIPKSPLMAGASWLLVSCGTLSTDGGAAKSVELTPPPSSAAVNYSVSASAGPADLARQAVAHHPSIIAAKHKAARLAATVQQEKPLPDPMAEIAAGSMAETAAGKVLASGGVKQKIPFPGKRREQAAAAE